MASDPSRQVAPERRLEASQTGKGRAYRLKRKEGIAEGAARIAAGRAEKAIEELLGTDDRDVAESVHRARKDLKKLRSLLRLVRGGLGEERFRIENERYRNAGRRLSESRDAVVKLDTLANLQDRFELPTGSLATWRMDLEAERDELGNSSDLPVQVDLAIGEIEAGRDEIGDWSLSKDSWQLLASGLRRSYRRGRREMKRARKTRSAVDVHAWRKRGKDLWYQLRVVRGAWRELIGGLADQTHELSDILGDHHDLSVLAEDLGRRENVAESRAFYEAIERHQAQLLDDALELGARLYAEKPKAFVRRIGAYWETWRPE